ncbi:ABC transporter permease [Fusobacterium necrophorum subsp. funduliforme]
MRKYVTIFKIALSNQLEYRMNFVSSFLFSLLPFGVNTLLWVAVAMKNKNMLLGVNEILCYYFVTLIVSNITTTSCIFKISDDIRLGELSKYIIKPYHYILYQLMLDMSQRVIFMTMNAIPIFLIYIFLSRYMTFSVRIERIILMLFFLGMGYLINFFIDFTIALYSFYFSRISSLYTSIKVIRNILAGSVFPLIMLPVKTLSVFLKLPFAYTSYFPTMFLIEDMPIRMAMPYMLIAVLWLFVFILGCIGLWKKGIKKYCAFGG